MREFAEALGWVGWFFVAATVSAMVMFVLDPSIEYITLAAAWLTCAFIAAALGLSRKTIATLERTVEIQRRTIELQEQTLDLQAMSLSKRN